VVRDPVSDSQEEIDQIKNEWLQARRVEQPETEPAEAVPPTFRQPAASVPRVYIVQQGDSLSQIAKKFYGDATRWRDIYEANKDQIKDPKIIRSGQELRIP
jgi:nucleoid-associated protein YgaU